MKSYLVTISLGASYQPIIESVIAESDIHAINYIIIKHKLQRISFANATESSNAMSTCTSTNNMFDLKFEDGLYKAPDQVLSSNDSSIDNNFSVTVGGQTYTFDIISIMKDLHMGLSK